MKNYEQPTVQIHLYGTDVITASVVYDERLGDFYMKDPFSQDNFTGGKE